MKISELEENIERMSYTYQKKKEDVWHDFLKYKIDVCRRKQSNQLELFPYHNISYKIMDEYILHELEEKYWRKE